MRCNGGRRRRAARLCVAALIAALLPAVSASPASAVPTCTFNGQPAPVLDITSLTSIAVVCGGLEPNQQIVVNEESPLAPVVEPPTSAPFEGNSDLGSPTIAGADGTLIVNFVVPETF